MDNFASGYSQEDYDRDQMEEGDYRVKILKVDPTAIAKSSGNAMIVMEMGIAEATFTFTYRLVKNEHFNSNATKFFDCFKIPRGNFEYNRWVGRVGMAHIAKGKARDNGKQYWEIQYLIVQPNQQAPAQQPRQPAMVAGRDYPPPQSRSVVPANQGRPNTAGFVDDIPGMEEVPF